ncbi:hypothetical protein [Chryseobacterium wanjuense]
MKKTIVLFLWFSITKAQSDNVGIGTPLPDPSAILDVKSSNKGMQLPIISLLPPLTSQQFPALRQGSSFTIMPIRVQEILLLQRGSTLTMERCGKKCGLNKK